MLKNVDVLADGRGPRESGHEQRPVIAGQPFPGDAFRARHEAAQLRLAPRIVRQQKEFLRGVEGREIADPPAARQHGLETPIREHPFEEAPAQGGDLEPPFFLHGQLGDRVHGAPANDPRPSRAGAASGPAPASKTGTWNSPQLGESLLKT